MTDRPLSRLRATEKALESGQPVPVTKHGAWERLRRKVARNGVWDVILDAVVRITFMSAYFVLRWPLRVIGFVLHHVNEPVRRFSAAHGFAWRTRSFFKRHPRLEVCVQLPLVLVWFAPVIAFAIRGHRALFPGKNVIGDIYGGWLVVLLAAAATVMGGFGNLPLAEGLTQPEEELDLGTVILVFGIGAGLPIVLTLWLCNLL